MIIEDVRNQNPELFDGLVEKFRNGDLCTCEGEPRCPIHLPASINEIVNFILEGQFNATPYHQWRNSGKVIKQPEPRPRKKRSKPFSSGERWMPPRLKLKKQIADNREKRKLVKEMKAETKKIWKEVIEIRRRTTAIKTAQAFEKIEKRKKVCICPGTAPWVSPDGKPCPVHYPY
jgi:hypothetical protein